VYRLTTKLREYQQDALAYALEHDRSVCVLPTGTGKTLVGISWAIELLGRGATDRVLVLEPSRFLVEQTARLYITHTDIPDNEVQPIYGAIHPESRRDLWKRGVVVVCTPQVALNDLFTADKQEILYSFRAVVIDECHRTMGRYAYVKLLEHYPFQYALGLTATLPKHIRNQVEERISTNVIEWGWDELRAKYPDYDFPDWIGEIYDAELNSEEVDFLLAVEKDVSTAQAFCKRAFTRDGALALKETINNPRTRLSWDFPEHLKAQLERLRELHKLQEVRDILIEHEFQKAIIFVDRVCIAKKLEEEFRELNPVCFLGRLRLGLEGQKRVLDRARAPEHRLIISTSAGEEGVDLPSADLLIIWSNVASPVRFIQRHGRITRPSRVLKVVAFIATPGTEQADSPDYDSLFEGLLLAREHGLDLAGLTDDESLISVLKTKTFRERVQTLLNSEPLSLEEIATSLGKSTKGTKRLEQWLDSMLSDEDVNYRISYFYWYPREHLKSYIEKWLRENYVPSRYVKPKSLARSLLNRIDPLSRLLRLYFPISRIGHVLEEYPDLFPSPESVDQLYVNVRIVPKRKRRQAPEAEKFGVLVSNGKWQLSTPLPTSVHESWDNLLNLTGFISFEEFIDQVFTIVKEQPVRIEFSAKGRPYFFKRLIYSGLFTHETLDLAFRNMSYIVQSIKEVLKEIDI